MNCDIHISAPLNLLRTIMKSPQSPLVYIFIFKPGMIGKNNHPCTTPGRLVLYDLYLEYFKCLNQFYAWDWKICMKVNIYQEASKNTNAHWAKKTMGVNQ